MVTGILQLLTSERIDAYLFPSSDGDRYTVTFTALYSDVHHAVRIKYLPPDYSPVWSPDLLLKDILTVKLLLNTGSQVNAGVLELSLLAQPVVNLIPADLLLEPDTAVFKRKLKSYLFRSVLISIFSVF